MVSWSSPKKDDSHLLSLTSSRDEKLLELEDSNTKRICITSPSPFPANASQPWSLGPTIHQQGNRYFPRAALYRAEGAYCQEVFPRI